VLVEAGHRCAICREHAYELAHIEPWAKVREHNAVARTTPLLYKNCTHLNAKYHHGVGKVGAHDHTSGVPVTNFYRSNSLYKRAMSYNRGLDRDKDGIACEKA
jgi:hypothetical protein